MPEVTLALHELDGLPGISICDVRGWGRSSIARKTRGINEAIQDYGRHNQGFGGPSGRWVFWNDGTRDLGQGLH